ncbi:MAG: transketolase [Clostridiales bacterium]|jgi:transketolase|nr:transketolase [Clostridiales bacterium]
MDPKLLNQIKQFATTIRIEQMKEFKVRGFGHVGGALSITDTFAVLYEAVMKYDPKNPQWEDRDKLVCSKGHAGPALYATLALKGFFPMDWLNTLNIPGTKLPSHCDRNQTPGIDMTTGSLGQGMSTALGLCLGDRIQGRDSYTFLIVGDGELNEGQIWEGAQFAGHQKLDHLIAFCDYNKKQLDGYTKDILDQIDIAAKFESFGWDAQEIDGQDAEAIYEAIQKAKATPGKPHMIVLNTIKGAGVKAVEDMSANHHIVVSAELADTAIADLEKLLAEQKG